MSVKLMAKKNGRSEYNVLTPGWAARYIREDAMWAREYFSALAGQKKDVSFASSGAQFTHRQKIILRPSSTWVPVKWRFSAEKSKILINMVKALEINGAKVFPDSRVVACYENKINMHQLFAEKKVRTPRTFTICDEQEYESAAELFGHTFIIKGPYSFSSKHVFMADGKEQSGKLRGKLFPPGLSGSQREPVLMQQYLSIRRDLRVVFVGEEIILSYWRLNNSGEWRSTATRYGSQVVFEELPMAVKDYLVGIIKKIEFPWGAFDVAWDLDDLNSEPYILEVSPSFEPNPPPPSGYLGDYHAFKYRSGFRYSMNYFEIVKNIAAKQVDHFLKQTD